jgi:3-hydroxybutyryl-CoA dehydrogenase
MSEQLGIAGAGAIACGLAACAARHGDVVLWARSEASAQRARAKIDDTATKMGDVDASKVRVVTDLSELADRTFVVEAIAEDHDHKCALLAQIVAIVSPDAMLSTTTSSLSVTDIAQSAGVADRFVGLHVFNPVPRMKLVELIFPTEAGPTVRERAAALCEQMDKTAVEVPDIPGFVVNRLLFPYLFSAVDLLDETGMDPSAIDTAMALGAGHPMGPLALLDFVGLDVSMAIGDEIGANVPQRLRDLVAEGRLGRKTGSGLTL